ncbi:MAG: YdcF family protein [Candidatus Woesearchaeota archaeon]
MNKYQELFEFLSPRDKLKKSDAVIGFGHFDMNIAKTCCEIYLKGLAKKIIYTGGVGAGSADFKEPEATEFFNYSKKHYPQIPLNDFMIENKSTNTGENILFTKQLKDFEKNIRSAILVATPTRQLRVYLTTKKHLDIAVINYPPKTSLDENEELFKTKNQDFNKQIIGEITRLIEYPNKGFCKPIKIPDKIMKAYKELI